MNLPESISYGYNWGAFLTGLGAFIYLDNTLPDSLGIGFIVWGGILVVGVSYRAITGYLDGDFTKKKG